MADSPRNRKVGRHGPVQPRQVEEGNRRVGVMFYVVVHLRVCCHTVEFGPLTANLY